MSDSDPPSPLSGGASPRVGVVGVPGRWSSEALADAVAERTGHRLLVDMRRVVAELDTGRVLFEGTDLCTLDALIVKKVGEVYSPDLLDRIEVLRRIEAAGVHVVSRPTSILRLIDRLACTMTLVNAGIPMPPTVVTEDRELAAQAVERFGSAVLKPLYSTKARGMHVVEAGCAETVDAELRAFQEEGNQTFYIQKRLDMPDRDLGVVFLGGRYLGTYARVSAKDSWNTTIRAGGRYERHEPARKLIELAERAQALFDLEFTSVDVVETASGPYVFEVSAFGGFRGLKEGLELDGAALYAEHVLRQIADR